MGDETLFYFFWIASIVISSTFLILLFIATYFSSIPEEQKEETKSALIDCAMGWLIMITPLGGYILLVAVVVAIFLLPCYLVYKLINYIVDK